MMKRFLSVALTLFLAVLLCSFFPDTPSFVPIDTESESSLNDTQSTDEPIPILSLKGRRYTFSGDPEAILAEEDLLTIRKGGAYRLRGTLREGGLRIAVGRDETVRLILDGVSLSATLRPCIMAESAAAVILISEEETVNLLRSEGDAVIVARVPLLFGGSGSLSLGGASVGIRSESTVTLEGGRITAVAKDKGISVRHVFLLASGSLTVHGAAFGIFSDGEVTVEGGSLTVVAAKAALCASDRICLRGGKGSFDAPRFYQCDALERIGGDFPTQSS